MKFISHRGNITGKDILRENTTEYIEEAIKAGFEVEIDLRMKDGLLYLGHDRPEVLITADWINRYSHVLWIHAKDYDSLMWLTTKYGLKYFVHEGDPYAITSNGYIWAHEYQKPLTKKCIIPLLSLEQVEAFNQNVFYGVCSDYVVRCKEKWTAANEKVIDRYRH